MTWRTVHRLLALALLFAFLWTGFEAWTLERLRQQNDELAALQSSQKSTSTDKASDPLSQRNGPLNLRLAEINRLSRQGHVDVAERSYTGFIRDAGSDPTGNDARFNLANLYLRQGIESGSDTPRHASLIELAKQGYRDLLRREPDYWSARYNLERALRLAPETDGFDNEAAEPLKRVNVVVPDFSTRDLP